MKFQMLRAYSDREAEASDLTAVIGDVGRHKIRLALTDERGRLQIGTIRTFESATQATISGAISAFGREAGLNVLPRRCALAVSGAARGETISITNSRYFVSRSGLRSMLREDPLIINDFAAIGWSLTSPDASARIESLSGEPVDPGRNAGTYCVVGIGSGLGVAGIQRDAFARVTVLPTEAGHANFSPSSSEWQPILEIMRRTAGCSSAEHMLSSGGLLRTYLACAAAASAHPAATDPIGVSRLHDARDPLAIKAVNLVCDALWEFAGNLALTLGAWDGLLLTGTLITTLAPSLRSQSSRSRFVLPGVYAREMSRVPIALASFANGELEGAARALLLRDASRSNQMLEQGSIPPSRSDVQGAA